MKIACLMGTYGRYTMACDALACFLQQTALEDAALLIYNQHPTQFTFDHPRVRIINEAANMPLRAVKYRMLDLAGPSVDLVHWWDDDDLMLPWHLEDCLRNVGEHVAWKPARSWFFSGEGQYKLARNVFEATAVYRPAALAAVPRDLHAGYPDHPANWELFSTGRVATKELGDLSSYIYRWATGGPHVSYYLRCKEGHVADIRDMRWKLTDPGPGGPMTPSDLWPHWQAFLDGIQSQVSEANHDEIYARLSLADAQSKLGAGGGT